MRGYYQKQVGLLLDVLPIVNKSTVFALKGGTAINFFFRNCPRLSVDIDRHYLPDNRRDDALADILKNMQAIKSQIEKALPGAKVIINEMLNPNMHDIEKLFVNQFQGMTKMESINLQNLQQVQKLLPQEIMNLFTPADKEFILGFKKGTADWNLLVHSHAKDLPAVRWKQKNIAKMESKKYQQAIKKLERVFK